MSKAIELIIRAKQKFIDLGFEVKDLSDFSKNGDYFAINKVDWRTTKEHTIGHRHICVEPTYRHNGTEDDVTVTMAIIETINTYGIGKIIEKIKIPKDASDKVLNNRIQKAIDLIR